MYAENVNSFEVIEIVTAYNLLVMVYCAISYVDYLDKALKGNYITLNVCMFSIFQIRDNITLVQYIQLFALHVSINV
jgi:hypothetical protein